MAVEEDREPLSSTLSQASMLAGAVFLSYASEDAAAAERIATALRIAGITVWFDREELRGGDAWDRKIHQQIHDCRLFLPIVSAHTEARVEGYFRREWRLAVDRTHDRSERVAFLVPVVIDSTSELKADVPDDFRHVQWVRLLGEETPPAFVERIRRLLLAQSSSAPAAGAPVSLTSTGRPSGRSVVSPWRSKAAQWVIGAMLAMALAYVAVDKLWVSRHLPPPPTPKTAPLTQTATGASASTAAFNPPPHSIAVLPFVNMSGDKEQEYFSEGLTEEVLNSLSRINGLQVAARTSSFSFQGEHPDISTVAHKLNVGAVLEGSVRRSAHTVRVTTQLVNGVTGFHIWSQTYDRGLGDVLKLQSEIATSVASALKVNLLVDEEAKIELGGTRNPTAFDAYLRASKALQSRRTANDIPRAIAAYTEAIRLDPTYALALAGRSTALSVYTGEVATGPEVTKGFAKAEADARRAITLAPELADAHTALALVMTWGSLDFARAQKEYARALALAPGDAQVLRQSGSFAASMGHFDAALAAIRRAVVLDPLDRRSYSALAYALYVARRYREAERAESDVITIAPEFKESYGLRGLALYGLGDIEGARGWCEMKRDDWGSQQCLAVLYDKLGRHSDAEAEFAKLKAGQGDDAGYLYATIYTQWGDRTKALQWLDTAMRSRDSGLLYLKTDPLMDPLRNEPRFQAIERALRFPD